MFDKVLKNEIVQIADEHNLDRASLFAVIEVESGGRLTASVGGRNEPLIRFEGHYFYRLLPNSKRNKALARGLASSKAGQVKNPYRQVSRWKLLKRAERIDRDAALQSCSWGCGQVIGSHWRWLGYSSVDGLVSEARSGAGGQLRLMMRYIKKAGLIRKLQSHDWAGFARAYNGPAYRRYNYHIKLRDAWYKHANDDDGSSHPLSRHGMAALRFGSVGDAVRDLQRNLRSLGYFLLVDGDFGPATERMLMAFQKDCRLKADAIFGPKTLEVMRRKLPVAA